MNPDIIDVIDTTDMIDIESVSQSLHLAMLATPFDTLGIHKAPSGKGLLVRSWHPDAESVEVITLPEGKSLGMMSPLADGIFELSLPRRKNLFNYELKVTSKDGNTFTYCDPYQFGEYILCQPDIDTLTLHHHLGALSIEHKINSKHVITGVLFKVYAPHARAVSVVGDFNLWDGRRCPMASADDGIWRLFVPGVAPEALYKFEIHDHEGRLLPRKSDPFGRKTEQWPGLASIVQEPSKFKWSDSEWLTQRTTNKNKPMSIYEMHAGSWHQGDQDHPRNYRDLANELVPYIKKMGFTHIELMPISEHPLYDSWGYQPVCLFSPTSRFGTPDDFRYFVNKCHEAGIGVILDWVPAHFPEDGHGLARFDGTALYEYEDPQRGWHPDWKSYIYNYGSRWVQDFLISSALFWLEEYHIDGLRVDAVASMLYLDYSRNHGEWSPNMHGGNEHLEAVDMLKRLNTELHTRFPGCMTIAEESTSWPGVSRPVEDNGLGFDYKWNMGWMHDSLSYMKHDPIHRKYHHHELTFSMVYAYSEDFVLPISHDEVVYGKGTLLTRMPGDDWQRHANNRAYLGFMYGHPGKKLLFMGAEIATTNEWNLNSSLDWQLLEQGPYHKGCQKLVQDLNHIYRTVPALYEREHDREGFEWLVVDDHDQSIVAFCRSGDDENPIVVISNMTPTVRHNYCIGAPKAGSWVELLNTDRDCYGGSNVINGTLKTKDVAMHNQKHSLELTLPPLATVILTLKNKKK